MLLPVEEKIFAASMRAPSGHNTQPWIVKRIACFHYVISNDRSRWLPAVDADQRETILSLGAFWQSLIFAAAHFGFDCKSTIIATSNQDEDVLEVLFTENKSLLFDIGELEQRRTLRSGFLSRKIEANDIYALLQTDQNHLYFFEKGSAESNWIDDATIRANAIQINREDAQKELSNWIRFSDKEAALYRDGLTTRSLQIDGLTGWWVRHFYRSKNVLTSSFKKQRLQKVKEQVAQGCGWLVLTSGDESVSALLEAGRTMLRLFVKVRALNIGLHPMSQLLEEKQTTEGINVSVGIPDPVRCIIRIGYVRNYPAPVAPRRSVGDVMVIL